MEKKEYIEREFAVQLIRECTKMQGKEIEKECDMPILRNVLNVYYLAREGATTLLEDIPAADAVEVIRCKDCKHYHHYGKTSLIVEGENIRAGWCQRRVRYGEDYRMLPDDYCSYGERKEE